MFTILNTQQAQQAPVTSEVDKLLKGQDSQLNSTLSSPQSEVSALASELDALIASRLGGSVPAASQTAVPQLTFNPNPKPPETPLMGFQAAANTTALTGIQAVSSVPQVKALTQKNPAKPSFIWRAKSSAPASVIGSTSTNAPSELSGQGVSSARLAPQVIASTQQAAAFMHSQNTHKSISVSSSPTTNMQYSFQSSPPVHSNPGLSMQNIQVERREKESGNNATQAFQQLINGGGANSASSLNSVENNDQQNRFKVALLNLKNIQGSFKDLSTLKHFMRVGRGDDDAREQQRYFHNLFGVNVPNHSHLYNEGDRLYRAIYLYLETFEEFDYQQSRNRANKDAYKGIMGMEQNPFYGGEGVFTDANSYVRHKILAFINRQIDKIVLEYTTENGHNLQNFLFSLESLSFDIAKNTEKFLKVNCKTSSASPNYDREEYILDKLPGILDQVLEVASGIRYSPRA